MRSGRVDVVPLDVTDDAVDEAVTERAAALGKSLVSLGDERRVVSRHQRAGGVENGFFEFGGKRL